MDISRRLFLKALATAPAINSCLTSSAAAVTPVIAGAIRWDAWYSDTGPARAAQNTLGYPPWQSRAPWFAKLDGPNHLTAVGTQADMDQECRIAAAAGLKYWAFDMYAPTSPMSVAWRLYQASPNRHLVNWCGIVGPGFLGSDPFRRADLWQAKDNARVAYFAQANYQKVQGDRPLLYILWSQEQLASYFAGTDQNFAASVAYLRARCRAAGVGDPYIVIMAGWAATSARIMREVGADAISNYIPVLGSPPVGKVPWHVLDSRVQAFWASQAAQGVECIPIATTGWDTRALRAHPNPGPSEFPHGMPEGYFVLPTDAQLRAEIQAAVAFVRAHPQTCRSNALLIYSWDECSEGGNPLIPTLGRPPGKSLMEAIARSL